MLEMIEKVLASLIILGMLVVIMFLAFDKNGGTEYVQAPPETLAPAPRDPSAPVVRETPAPETPPVVPDPGTPPPKRTVAAPSAPKSDLPPAVANPDEDGVKKTEEQLPKSQVATKPRAAKTRHETRIVRVPPPLEDDRDDDHIRRNLTRAQYREPWRRTDYYECAGGSCDCSCEHPYWARSGPCWD